MAHRLVDLTNPTTSRGMTRGTEASGVIDITVDGQPVPPLVAGDDVANVIVDVVGYFVTDVPID